jgi:hypothetical protein
MMVLVVLLMFVASVMVAVHLVLVALTPLLVTTCQPQFMMTDLVFILLSGLIATAHQTSTLLLLYRLHKALRQA